MNWKKVIIIVALSIIGLCLIVAVIGALSGGDTETEPTEIAAVAQPVAQPTEELAGEPVEEAPPPTEEPTQVPPTPTAEPTDTPEPIGLTRDNPAPFGTEVVTQYQIQKVEEIVRPADAQIKEANMFNSDPEPGNEFVMVNLTIQCIQPADEKCNIYLSDYTLSGSTGLIREPNFFVAGLPHLLETTEMFGGATLSGWLIFEVGQGETGLILAWEPTFSMSTAYMSLPDN